MDQKFRTGDRVFHRGMKEYGTVGRIEGDVVSVIYDRKSERTGLPWQGMYDSMWFEIHPEGLVKTDRAAQPAS